MACGSDQSDKLSMLDGDNERISPELVLILPQIGWVDCTIRVFLIVSRLDDVQPHTSKIYTYYTHFYMFYINTNTIFSD